MRMEAEAVTDVMNASSVVGKLLVVFIAASPSEHALCARGPNCPFNVQIIHETRADFQ